MRGCDDPDFDDCRKGRHSPTNIEQEWGSEVGAICSTCGADLSATVRDWDAVYPEDQCCVHCGAAQLHCGCDTFERAGDLT